MRILLANPPWFDSVRGSQWIAGVRAGSRWPFTLSVTSAPDSFRFGDYLCYPFFQGYAATYLAKATGAQVEFRDSIALRESYDSFYRTAKGFDYIFIETATPSWDHDAKIIDELSRQNPGTKIVVTGPITTTKSEEILSKHPVHACIRGEYEKGSVRVVNGESGIIDFDLLTTEEMNAAPFPYMDANIAWRYFDANPQGQRHPQAQVWSSRGCPFKCLAGDTPINTVYGPIPIKDLVGNEIGVFTYDLKEGRGKVCTGKNIRKTGENQKLVRVKFDDGTHIDCTPDHKFLVFKWGNQFVGEREYEVEAKDLKAGQHLRAIREYNFGNKNRYINVSWKRKSREAKHRMIAEWKIGRRLAKGEHVHHINHDATDNRPENLEVAANAKEHYAKHPEIAERMRVKNPTANGIDVSWRQKLSESNLGKKRSAETCENCRIAALRREANMTAEEKSRRAKKSVATIFASGRKPGMKKSAKDQIVNHCVVSVEELPGLHDTYCMEVPDTGWFYANDVLVHNCAWCVFPAAMTNNDPDGTGKRMVRHYKPEYMEAFLEEWRSRFGFRCVYFDDDTFNLGDKHVLGMCEVMRKLKMPWSAMCRADTIKRETWQEMRASGCFGVKLGYESGSQEVIDKIIHKNLDLAKARETTIYLKSLGFTIHGTFTYGNPGETVEQMLQTRRYRESLPLDSYQESGVAAIEGTPLARIEQGERLTAYPLSIVNDDYLHGTDGNRKMAELETVLR